MARWIVRAAQDLARVIVPVSCPGCGEMDLRWCDGCEAVWWEDPLRSESVAGRLDIPDRPILPVWSIASLEGSAHGMIAAWKDAGRRDLDALFTRAMERAATVVAASIVSCGFPVAVVPAAARTSNTRRRGADLPLLLARAAAAGLGAAGVSATVFSALKASGRHSRQLSARERWRGASARIALAARPPSGRGVVLVDDVLTTGATLATCVARLESAGAIVLAGLTLAVTEVTPQRPELALR